MKSILKMIFLAAVLQASVANAFTGNDIIAMDELEISMYIAGVGDTADGILFCTPGVTYGQLKAIFKKFMDNHPELWNKNANILVAASIHEVFPCPTETKKKPESKF